MSWDAIIAAERNKPYYLKLKNFIESEYQENIIYPSKKEIYNALSLTSFDDVKVVILGQDPYHGTNQAHGLSFSVQPNVKIPPSLRNIYQELGTDIGVEPVNHGCLTSWARQGVLLLNTVLTVRAGEANSHQGHGWEVLTDKLITELNNHEKPIVFMLWGKQAIQKSQLINQSKHYILSAPHPSPLSAYRGFFGSRPFSKANEILKQTNQQVINWQLPSLVEQTETASFIDI